MRIIIFALFCVLINLACIGIGIIAGIDILSDSISLFDSPVNIIVYAVIGWIVSNGLAIVGQMFFINSVSKTTKW